MLRQGSTAGTTGTIGGQATNRPAGWRWAGGLSIDHGSKKTVHSRPSEIAQRNAVKSLDPARVEYRVDAKQVPLPRVTVGSAGGAYAARSCRLALVSSRRHLEPCMRFSRTRLTDVLHRRHSAPLTPRPVESWRGDGSVEGDQSEAIRGVGENPEAVSLALLVALGDQASQASVGVEHDLVEELGGVSVAEVARPAAQEPVEVPNDDFDWDFEP